MGWQKIWGLGLAGLVCMAAAPEQILPSGDVITPLAAPGAHFTTLSPHLPAYPAFLAGQPINEARSGNTLLILTSGYNRLAGPDGKAAPGTGNEYVFVYDVAAGLVQTQVLTVPDTYVGIAFAPDGRHFYVSGGVDDDVHVFALNNGVWAERAAPIALGHYAGIDRKDKAAVNRGGSGLNVQPQAAGLAVTADGAHLLVANFYNDTASLIDLASNKVAAEIPLRPGDISRSETGKPGGAYPFEVAVAGNDTAYISSLRDREIDVVSLAGAKAQLTARIALHGNPNSLILNKAATTLYVTADNSDDVTIIDTRSNRVRARIRTIAPPSLLADAPQYRGVGPNNLVLSPDEQTLYVTNGGTNSVAVIDLASNRVTGLIPTGYFPNAVQTNADGTHLYVVNGKSIAGPNPSHCTPDPDKTLTVAACRATNSYILQLSKGGLLDLPVPDAAQLAATTATAAANEHFDELPSARDEAIMSALHERIKHVIYIVRENRTYDEVLGDLGEGNGNAALAEFGATITPNAHGLAQEFVDLDNFYDSGEVSGNGWPWSTSAHESDLGAKNLAINYGQRGLSYDWEGQNRYIDVAIRGVALRKAADPLIAGLPDLPNILAGPGDAAAPDGPAGQYQRGYLWDAAIRAGLSVRNYGFFLDLERYDPDLAKADAIAETENPAGSKMRVAWSTNPALAPRTDPYFRGFDTAFPDFYREAEWQREFNAQIAAGSFPNLTLLRLMRDHLGSFKTAIDGVNTPELQMADNDDAVGRVIEAVAHSKYAGSTLIFIVEDDAQDGPDHVDAHRSLAFIVGPYVKQHAVISTHYTTVNLLRTIEDVLGIDHLSVNDAFARPMADCFDLAQARWDYTAITPAPLSATSLPVAKAATNWRSTHDGDWWAAQTAGYDWSQEDRVPAVAFNEILWAGLHSRHTPYPGNTAPGKGDDAD